MTLLRSVANRGHLMRTALLLLGVLITSSAPAADDGFTPLFDGKSLDGWTFIVKADKDGKKADPKQTWSVTDGTIRCTGKPNGCMVTAKEYGDYVLRVKWRFQGEHGHYQVVANADDFKARMENQGDIEDLEYVKKLLERYPGHTYILDQLATRFAGPDGILSKKELEGLDRYIKGRITYDQDKTVGNEYESKEDWDRMLGIGVRVKDKAVQEIINDPSVMDRLWNGSFDGDVWAGGYKNGWMDNEGGYLSNIGGT